MHYIGSHYYYYSLGGLICYVYIVYDPSAMNAVV